MLSGMLAYECEPEGPERSMICDGGGLGEAWIGRSEQRLKSFAAPPWSSQDVDCVKGCYIGTHQYSYAIGAIRKGTLSECQSDGYAVSE